MTLSVCDESRSEAIIKLIKKSDRDNLFYPRLDLSLTEDDPPHINSIRITAIKTNNSLEHKKKCCVLRGRHSSFPFDERINIA